MGPLSLVRFTGPGEEQVGSSSPTVQFFREEEAEMGLTVSVTLPLSSPGAH